MPYIGLILTVFNPAAEQLPPQILQKFQAWSQSRLKDVPDKFSLPDKKGLQGQTIDPLYPDPVFRYTPVSRGDNRRPPASQVFNNLQSAEG